MRRWDWVTQLWRDGPDHRRGGDDVRRCARRPTTSVSRRQGGGTHHQRRHAEHLTPPPLAPPLTTTPFPSLPAREGTQRGLNSGGKGREVRMAVEKGTPWCPMPDVSNHPPRGAAARGRGGLLASRIPPPLLPCGCTYTTHDASSAGHLSHPHYRLRHPPTRRVGSHGAATTTTAPTTTAFAATAALASPTTRRGATKQAAAVGHRWAPPSPSN